MTAMAEMDAHSGASTGLQTQISCYASLGFGLEQVERVK